MILSHPLKCRAAGEEALPILGAKALTGGSAPTGRRRHIGHRVDIALLIAFCPTWDNSQSIAACVSARIGDDPSFFGVLGILVTRVKAMAPPSPPSDSRRIAWYG